MRPETQANTVHVVIRSSASESMWFAAAILVVSVLVAPLPVGGSDVQARRDSHSQIVAARGTAHSTAATSGTATPRRTLKFNKGLLWKIESRGRQPSYLFGTIHSADPRVTRLPPPVRAAFDEASSFTMELLISGAGIVSMAEAMFFSGDQTLRSVVGEDLYVKTQQAMTDHGLPIQGLNKKKPWVVLMLLSTPRPEPRLALDMLLQLQATVQGKQIYGLETMEEQIAVFNDMPIDEQVALLQDTIRLRANIDRQFESMLQAYRNRDLAVLMSLVYESGPQGTPAYDNLLERLLARRNTIMVKRMRAQIEAGNAFIAIGAAHLAGEHGLLRLLEQEGYRITAVY